MTEAAAHISTEVTLADHERRITLLEQVDKWSLRLLLALAALKFFGIDNASQIVHFFSTTGGKG